MLMMRLMMGLRVLCVRGFIACVLFPVLGITGASAAAEVQYDIHVQIDPVARSIKGRSVITANTAEELTLVIGRRFEVMHARVDADPIGPAATVGNLRAWRIS